MDTNNWRPAQGGTEPTMETGDWRTQLQPDSRQRIVNKIVDTLKRHPPFSGQLEPQELKKVAVRFEEEIYTAATSQSDYLRKISLKMLSVESKSQNSTPDYLPSNSATSENPTYYTGNVMDTDNLGPAQGGTEPTIETGDWREQLLPDSRQRIINKIMDTLKRNLPFSGQDGLQELKKIAVRFEEKMYTAATSQSDYLRKISLKMVTMESKSQNTIPNSQPSNSATSENPTDNTDYLSLVSGILDIELL